jgi:hypothetical protein
MKKAFMDLKALKMKVIHSYIMGNHFPKDTSYARRLEISSPKGLLEQKKKNYQDNVSVPYEVI